jgi:hypothetical protein
MSERNCANCGQTIVPGVCGNLCLKCKLDELAGSPDNSPSDQKKYCDVKDLSELTGYSEEHVRRMARNRRLPPSFPGIKKYIWPRQVVEDHFPLGQPPTPKIPASPIQEKALAMCRRHDHSWLREEEYEGNSYIREPKVESRKNGASIGFDHICYFCGYTEYHPFGR